ncbi:MAG: PP2C family protein-serine/threonine phosphatase, partial [Bacteroidota bacterium]
MARPTWHLKLRTQFLLAFLGVIAIVMALSTGLFYHQAHQVLMEQMRERLKLTASLAATNIDGEEHRQIHSMDARYARVKDVLIRFRKANPEVRAAYTMRPVKGKIWEFVVDAESPTSKAFSPCGEKYDVSEDPANEEGLTRPAASTRLYPDQFGVWLSGYAPISSKDGPAVVGVDMSAQRVIEAERSIQRMSVGIFLLGMLLAYLVSLLIARLLNRPIDQLVEGARRASQGDLEVRIPESRHDELGELAQVFNHMLGDLARQREELKEQERMSQELATARKIQQAMLPSEPPDSRTLSIDFYAEPASEVGGDYFDFLPLENGQMAIAIGDVTGHGVPAALLMAMVKSCL